MGEGRIRWTKGGVWGSRSRKKRRKIFTNFYLQRHPDKCLIRKAFNSRHSENSIYSQQQSPAYWCILVLYEIVSAIHLEILLRGHILPPGDLRHGLHHVADVAVLALKTAGYILGHLKTEGEHVCARLEVFALACLENGGPYVCILSA